MIRSLVVRCADIGPDRAIGADESKLNTAVTSRHGSSRECAVAIVHEARLVQRAIGRHGGAGESSCRIVQSFCQSNGLRVMRGINGDELADLADSKRSLIQGMERVWSGDLEAYGFRCQDRKHTFEHVLPGQDGR